MRLPHWLHQRLFDRAVVIAARRPPDFVIGGDDNPYLRRWWVIPRNRVFNVYLHHFMRSDDDRALHCHPWINASILLTGEYDEHTIAAGGVHSRHTYRAGDIKLRRAKAAHRVELTDGPCWTLFITGPTIRQWGFHCPGGWRPWQEFTKPGDSGSIGKGCD